MHTGSMPLEDNNYYSHMEGNRQGNLFPIKLVICGMICPCFVINLFPWLYQPLYNKTFFANDIWNKSYMNCGNEMKVKKWSSQWTQFMQLRKEALKKNSGLQRGLHSWPCDYRCDALPTELWSHWRWGQINRPFYRYGGHFELIQFKEYYRMPRGHEHISFVFSSAFRDIFS